MSTLSTPSEQSLMHNSNRLTYITAGSPDNPPVILVHGYTSSYHVWRTTIPLLEDDFYCIAINLLGHGTSDMPADGDYRIRAQAARVVTLADTLNLDTFALIGHSMGGQTSLYVASELVPERVTGLVNVSGVISPGLHDFVEATTFRLVEVAYRLPALGWLSRQWRNQRWWARVQFASWFYDMNALDFDAWAIDRDTANRHDAHIIWYHGKHAIKGQDMTPLLPKITAPVLTMFGADDRVIQPGDKHIADKRIENHQLEVFENCGHFPMYEATEAYQNAVQSFMHEVALS
jgi:pimeloyl-ACP methyl ester carboxylesterase